MRLLKRILLILLIIIVVLVGGAVGAFYLTPSATIASAAASGAREATGRELTIEGEITRTLFPVLGVRTGRVTLSNAEWADQPVMLAADSAEFGVKLLPLLAGAFEIETIRLDHPDIALEVSEDGQPNWAFGEPREADRKGRGGDGRRGGRPPALIIKDARITQGAFSYLDRRTGQRVTLTEIDATLTLPALDRTMSLDGSAMIEGKRATLSAALDSPAKAAAGEATLTDVKFEAEGARFGFNGEFRAPRDGGAPEGSGDLNFALDADRQTTAWLREALPPQLAELGGVDVKGKITATPAALDLDLTGDGDFKGKASQIRVTAAAGDGWMTGAVPARVDVSAKNDFLDAGYSGTAALSPEGAPSLKGAWRAKVPNAKALYAWAGATPAEGDPLAKLESMDMSGDLDWSDAAAKATLTGGLGFNGRSVAVEGDVNGGADWKTGGAVNSSFTAKSDGLFSFGWGGVTRMTQDGPPTVEGALRFTSRKLRDFAAWGGAGPIEAPAGSFETVALDTEIAVGKDRAALRNIAIHIDDAAVTGEVTVLTGGERPNVTAKLETGALDLRPFTRGGGGTGGATASGGGGSAGGWSDDPLELGVLKLVDASIDIGADGLTTNVFRFGRSHIFSQLNNGRLEMTISEMALYGGSAKGKAIVDARATPSVSLDVDVASVQIRPMLNDMAKLDSLEGTGAVTLKLAGQGVSVKAIMRSLGGDASMKLTDGAIIGYNLASVVRNVTSLGSAAGEEKKTDFAEMSGTFQVASGVASNKDFQLFGPLVRMTGAGTIDIGAQTLDYRLEPKAVATIRGQGGPADAKGLSFPVLVTGPWANPSVKPDLAGGMRNIESILQDPNAALDQIKGLGEGGGNVGDAVRGLTGGGDAGGGLGGALRGLTGGGAAPAQPDAGAAPSGGGLGGALRGLAGGGGDTAPQQPPQDGGGAAQPSPGGLIKGLFGK